MSAITMSQTSVDPHRSLRRAFYGNATFSLVSAAVLILGAGALAAPFGLADPLWLELVGASLVPFGLFVAWLARRPDVPRRLAWGVCVADAGWVVASVALLVGWPDLLSDIGRWVVIGVAVVVADFGLLQARALRR